MYCNNCGRMLEERAVHCSFCGKGVAVVVARRKLVRPREGRKVAGVCLGVAEFFDLDPTVVRLVWLVVAIFTGVGFFAYPIAWIVMPEEPLRLLGNGATEQRPVAG